jgi:hypothetical protein
MRWQDDVGSNLKKMKVKRWREKMRDREQWGSFRAVVTTGRKDQM